MRVIIGGAHNGKRNYVKKLLAGKEHRWLDCQTLHAGACHQHNSGGVNIQNISGDRHHSVVVVDRVECWLAETELGEAEAVELLLKATDGKDVIFILTDIGRGIVPMDAGQRALRDACGRLYQQLMERADEVTRIWYGLPQTLKKRGEII